MTEQGRRRWVCRVAQPGLGDQLTLSQPEGADCAPTLLLAHPALVSFLCPCYLGHK